MQGNQQMDFDALVPGQAQMNSSQTLIYKKNLFMLIENNCLVSL